MRHAYAPYSDFPVGVAGLVDDGRVVVGCNVENAAYGVGLCAECGLVSALHATGGGRLVALRLRRTATASVMMPCGRCRQLLFGSTAARTSLLLTARGCAPMTEVLPDAFGARCARRCATTSLDLTAPEVVADPYPCVRRGAPARARRLARAVRVVPDVRPRRGQRRAARPPARPDLGGPEPRRALRAVQPAAPQPDDGERAARAHPAAPAGRRRVLPRPRRAAAARGSASSPRSCSTTSTRRASTWSGTTPSRCRSLVIAELLGVPEPSRAAAAAWSQAIVRMYEVAPSDAGRRTLPSRAAAEFADVRPRARPRAAPPSRATTWSRDLVAAQDGAARLSEDEVVASAMLLLNAGHEASVNVFGNGAGRDAARRMSGPRGRARCRPCVEEMLRFDSALQLFERTATAPVERRRTSTVEPGQKIAAPARRGQPRPGGVRRRRRRSTSAATPTRTWRSAPACTSASARRWPGWSWSSRWRCCSATHPQLRPGRGAGVARHVRAARLHVRPRRVLTARPPERETWPASTRRTTPSR